MNKKGSDYYRIRVTIIGALFAAALMAAALLYLSARSDAEQRLLEARQALLEENVRSSAAILVAEGNLGDRPPQGMQLLAGPRDCRAITAHDGMLYLGTGCGLLRLQPDGTPDAFFTHFQGLPGNAISALAVYGGDLYIGGPGGLARISGERVAVLKPADVGDFAVTCLAIHEDRLVIGTRKQGIIEFDGNGFGFELMALPGADFRDVTSLSNWHGRLAIGTRESGLYILDGAGFEHIDTEHGLPHDHVTDVHGEKDLLVATIGGICTIKNDYSVVPASRSLPASAVLQSGTLAFIGTLDGRIETIGPGRPHESIAIGTPERPAMINDLVEADGRLWVLTSEGLRAIDGGETKSVEILSEGNLVDGHIAALAVDSLGRLWIGTFDRGLEVRSPDLTLLRRFGDPAVRTVKCLYFDAEKGAVWVGGSKGLVSFSGEFNREHWTHKEGLIGNEVNSVTRMPGGDLAIGTGSGLTFFSDARMQSIYAFHGLANNKVFALQPVSDPGGSATRLAVGTLGGISIVGERRVVDRITPENSGLPIHWITALLDYEGSLLIGTYGGGLSLLTPEGGWLEMPPEVRDIEINPNALLLDDDLLLAGTLDRGLIILRRDTDRWEVLRDGLPSLNVTALAADPRRYYIGTDNGLLVVDKGSL